MPGSESIPRFLGRFRSGISNYNCCVTIHSNSHALVHRSAGSNTRVCTLTGILIFYVDQLMLPDGFYASDVES